MEKRFNMLSWIVLPIILLFLSIGYVKGLTNETDWKTSNTNNSAQISIEEIQNSSLTDKPETIVLDGKGMYSIVFTDALSEHYEIAKPILDKNDMKAAVTIPTNFLGDPGYLDEEKISSLAQQDWEIISHTRNNLCEIDEKSQDIIRLEIENSKLDLERLELPVFTNILPCGNNDPKIRELSKENYKGTITSEVGLNELPLNDPYSIRTIPVTKDVNISDLNDWIEKTEKSGTYLVIVIHKIDDEESLYNISKKDLETLAWLLNHSDLRNVTPNQVININYEDEAILAREEAK